MTLRTLSASPESGVKDQFITVEQMGEFTLFDGMDPGYFFIEKTIGMKDDIELVVNCFIQGL